MNHLSPGVYTEIVNTANSPIEAVSSSNGGFVGIAVRGAVNKPILVTSWQNFLDTFAYGLDTPFLANSDLAYAVYGFFQNGGTKCYVIRTASSSAKIASGKVGETTFNAKDEGTWGNKLKLGVKANADTPANFDITVKYGEDIVEVFTNVSNTTTDENYFIDAINGSKFITCASGTLSVTDTDTAFTNGADGIEDIKDSDYKTSLEKFNLVEDVNLICIPGQTSATLITDLVTYVTGRKNTFAIIDGPETATIEEIKTFRKTISLKYGALHYPWLKVSDPLSKTGKLRVCPPCGHIMGVYARTIQERGVWKAPAGVEAVVRGAIEVVTPLQKAEVDTLNPLDINSIIVKPNYGIVSWGARSLNPDSSMKYISDVLLETYIKESVNQGTQWAVFEPNDDVLRTKVKTTIETFLDGLWRDGGLKGKTASEAYYVKCDDELNTEETQNAGMLICEVGYASHKPAEFVVIRIAHKISNE